MAVLVGLQLGCSSSSDPPNTDLAVADGPVVDGPSGDAGPAVALQLIVDKLLVPDTPADYAVDLDGDGVPDNHVGQILAALSGANPTLDLKKQIIDQINQGKVLLLWEVQAKSLTDDPATRVVAYGGVDLDGNPGNNFSGKETLGIDPKGPKDTVLQGKIVGGQLSVGPGDFEVPIPIGEQLVRVNAIAVQFSGKVSVHGMTEGVLSGAIPIEQVTDVLVPALALEMQRQYVSTVSTPEGKAALRDLFDLDKNGSITLDEVRNNPLIGLLLSTPDVDMDGDGTADSISVGLGITAVPCVIKH